jgi:hypothetical protein
MSIPTATRPAAGEYLEYYGRYIALVPENDALEALERSQAEVLPFLRGLSEAQGQLRYAPDKWSIKQMLGHVADSELVLVYRALRIARADQTPLPGFDENDYVKAATFDRQPYSELVDRLESEQRATLAMFRGLDAEAWTRTGVANNHVISVRALAYIIAGHARHHRNIIRERYLGAGTGVARA